MCHQIQSTNHQGQWGWFGLGMPWRRPHAPQKVSHEIVQLLPADLRGQPGKEWASGGMQERRAAPTKANQKPARRKNDDDDSYEEQNDNHEDDERPKNGKKP